MWIAGAIFILNSTQRDFRGADFEAAMRRKMPLPYSPGYFHHEIA